MTDLAGAAGVAAEEIPVDADTKLTLHPVRFQELGELDEWVKDEPIRRAFRIITDMEARCSTVEARASLRERTDTIMRAAFEESSRLSVNGGTAEGYISSVEGSYRVILKSIQRGDASFTLRQLKDILDTPEKVQRVGEVVARISGLKLEDLPFTEGRTPSSPTTTDGRPNKSTE